MKKIFIALMLLVVVGNTYAQNGGDFYVIPVIKNVEVCNGTPVGNKAFTLPESEYMTLGDVFSTSAGFLIQITGFHNPTVDVKGTLYIRYNTDDKFRVASNSLPRPGYGVKGPYYYLTDGGLAYAKYL